MAPGTYVVLPFGLPCSAVAVWLQCCRTLGGLGGLASSELSFRRYRQLRLLFIGLQGASQRHVGLARPKYLRKGFKRSFKRIPRCGLWDWLGLLGTGSDSSGFCGEPWSGLFGDSEPLKVWPVGPPCSVVAAGLQFCRALGTRAAACAELSFDCVAMPV